MNIQNKLCNTKISNETKRLLSKVYLHSYRHLCRVHEAQSEVVFLYDVHMVHDLFKQLLTFGFFLIKETHKQTGLYQVST